MNHRIKILLVLLFTLSILSCNKEENTNSSKLRTYFYSKPEAGLKPKVVAHLKEGEKVNFLNKESKIKLLLRGKHYNSPFVKVKTQSNIIGWV